MRADHLVSELPAWLEPVEGGVRLRVKVQPRASRTGVAGVVGDRLKLRVAAPPVDGAANAALGKWLAKLLGVRRAAVQVASGQTGRDKSLVVEGVVVADVVARLS